MPMLSRNGLDGGESEESRAALTLFAHVKASVLTLTTTVRECPTAGSQWLGLDWRGAAHAIKVWKALVKRGAVSKAWSALAL